MQKWVHVELYPVITDSQNSASSSKVIIITQSLKSKNTMSATHFM